jgi:hypothetical protein
VLGQLIQERDAYIVWPWDERLADHNHVGAASDGFLPRGLGVTVALKQEIRVHERSLESIQERFIVDTEYQANEHGDIASGVAA